MVKLRLPSDWKEGDDEVIRCVKAENYIRIDGKVKGGYSLVGKKYDLRKKIYSKDDMLCVEMCGKKCFPIKTKTRRVRNGNRGKS